MLILMTMIPSTLLHRLGTHHLNLNLKIKSMLKPWSLYYDGQSSTGSGGEPASEKEPTTGLRHSSLYDHHPSSYHSFVLVIVVIIIVIVIFVIIITIGPKRAKKLHFCPKN